MSPPLLEVRGLLTRYRSGRLLGGQPVLAVNGVDLGVDAGETVGLVGESGSGKSSLGRTILRLTPAAGGTVRFGGADVLAARGPALRQLRRRMQVVFQDPWSSLDPRMALGDSVAEGLDIHRIVPAAARPERVAELFHEVGLDPDLMARYPHQCSGGQRQRAGIARALAVDPEFVVLDEPVSALDVSVQAQVLDLLAGLQQRRGVAYLFIGHDLAVVRQLARRIAVMYAGQVVESGAADTVIREPLHPYTRALVAAAPRPEPGRRRGRVLLAGEPPAPGARPAGCPFASRCTHPARDARCTAEAPELRPVGSGLVACHHAATPSS